MRADQFEKKERQLRTALEETSARLGRHFANPAARQSAAAYLQSLLSSVERKNSWQLAEIAGFDTPYRFQHLLGRGAWEADALRDEHLGVVLAGLGQEDAVLAIDETGFIKQGKKSVGVKRQYCGHQRARWITARSGVFLSWQTSKGHALDRPRALLAARVGRGWGAPRGRPAYPRRWPSPPSLLWRDAMLARVLATGARPAWVVADDCVYGGDYKLRVRPWKRPDSLTWWPSRASSASGDGLRAAARQDHQGAVAR